VLVDRHARPRVHVGAEVEPEHARQVVAARPHALAVDERVHPPLLVGVERLALAPAGEPPPERPEPEPPPLGLRPVAVDARVVLAGRARGGLVGNVAERGPAVDGARAVAEGPKLENWLDELE